MGEEGYLSKKDPFGYYVLVLKKGVSSLVAEIGGVIVEEYGECIVVKTRSRRIAQLIIRRFKGDICVEEL